MSLFSMVSTEKHLMLCISIYCLWLLSIALLIASYNSFFASMRTIGLLGFGH